MVNIWTSLKKLPALVKASRQLLDELTGRDEITEQLDRIEEKLDELAGRHETTKEQLDRIEQNLPFGDGP